MRWQTKVVSTEIRKILAYRSDFWINFLGQTLIQLFIARALWQSIFESNGINEMKGLTLPQLTLYYLLAPLTMKILMGENIGFLSREIYDGGLNRYLVWPLPPLGYKALTFLTYSCFYLAQLLIIYSIARLLLDDSPYQAQELLRLFLGMGYILIAALGYFFLMALCEMVAFWADNTWTLGVMLRFVAAFLGGAFIPLTFFPESLRHIVELLPFASMISGPVNLILGRASLMESFTSFLVMLAWLPFLYFSVLKLWKKGNLQYTGVGM
jgi:ABC-2 type transport system permease protein